MSRPAAGGGRWVDVAPERLDGFLRRFAERHGDVAVAQSSGVLLVTAADGSLAECHAPFPPLPAHGDGAVAVSSLVAHATRDRRVGVILVRRGGFAVGLFDGPRLLASKVGGRYVQGRTAAGGWSQQRFARRRDHQARSVWQSAAETAAALLVPVDDTLDALVVGGDVAGCDEVLADARLGPLLPLLADRRLDVPEPRLRVLTRAPELFRAVRVRVVDVAPTSGAKPPRSS